MKKYFILLLILLLTGCYSIEDKKLVKQYKKQGKENAINYVKEKYNIDAKVIKVKEEVECNNSWKCINSTPTGLVNVKMSIDDKKFNVYVTGKESSNNATDDYQLNTIEKDIISYLKNNINIEFYDYKLKFNTNAIKELYNNNLNDMAKYIDSIELYYIEKDLNSINTDNIYNFLQTYNGNIDLINFKSEETCDTYKKVEFDKKEFLIIYKTDELIINKNNRTYYTYDKFTTYNDEVYTYSPTTNNKFEISESNFDDIKNFKKLYKDLNYKKITLVSNIYEINRPREILYVYFPKNNLKNNYKDKLFVASECFVKGVKKQFINSYFHDHTGIRINDIGSYYTEEENFSICDANTKVSFALIKVSY